MSYNHLLNLNNICFRGLPLVCQMITISRGSSSFMTSQYFGEFYKLWWILQTLCKVLFWNLFKKLILFGMWREKTMGKEVKTLNMIKFLKLKFKNLSEISRKYWERVVSLSVTGGQSGGKWQKSFSILS